MRTPLQYPTRASAGGHFGNATRATAGGSFGGALGSNMATFRLGALGRSVTVGSQTVEINPMWAVLNLAASGGLAYHGYKRNDSIGWALVWGIFGGMIWPIMGAVALAQGYGEPKGRG